jgi:hypothetical protein
MVPFALNCHCNLFGFSALIAVGDWTLILSLQTLPISSLILEGRLNSPRPESQSLAWSCGEKIQPRLDGVSERWTPLQDFPLLIGLTVLTSKVDGVDHNNGDDERIACHSRVDSWAIMGRILRPED